MKATKALEELLEELLKWWETKEGNEDLRRRLNDDSDISCGVKYEKEVNKDSKE